MTGRIDSIVYFRAVTILLIVAGHSFELAGIRRSSFVDLGLVNLLKGNTGLFVFISGFLLHHVYGSRFVYKEFIVRRFTRIFIPYLFLTALAQFLFLPTQSGLSEVEEFKENILFGSTFQAYWYVPFILATFLITPLHRSFAEQKGPFQVVLIAVFMIVAMVIQRPIENLNVLQSLLFFTPAYLVGIFIAVHSLRVFPFLRAAKFYLVAAVVAIISIQAALGQSDNLHNALFRWQGIELMVLQKPLLSLMLISLFTGWTINKRSLPNLIAETSLAIFLIHPFVLKYLGWSRMFQITGMQWINLCFVVISVTAISMIIALGLRFILGKRSKFFTGY